ncbi:MAG: hypothetical protein H7Z40_21295 [Phycisphaerae bacterium]|nr:hypothetical protein [Gemmatimonadaceae bacterium]
MLISAWLSVAANETVSPIFTSNVHVLAGAAAQRLSEFRNWARVADVVPDRPKTLPAQLVGVDVVVWIVILAFVVAGGLFPPPPTGGVVGLGSLLLQAAIRNARPRAAVPKHFEIMSPRWLLELWREPTAKVRRNLVTSHTDGG